MSVVNTTIVCRFFFLNYISDIKSGNGVAVEDIYLIDASAAFILSERKKRG